MLTVVWAALLIISGLYGLGMVGAALAELLGAFTRPRASTLHVDAFFHGSSRN